MADLAGAWLHLQQTRAGKMGVTSKWQLAATARRGDCFQAQGTRPFPDASTGSAARICIGGLPEPRASGNLKTIILIFSLVSE